MNMWTCLRDWVRVIVAALVGMTLAEVTLVMALVPWRRPVPWGIMGYALALGSVACAGGVLWECLRRRPFERAIAEHLATPDMIAGFSTPVGATTEQRLVADLMGAYARQAAAERGAAAAQQRQSQTFATEFAHQMKTPLSVMVWIESALRERCTSADVEIHDLLEQWETEREALDQAVALWIETARISSFAADARMETIALSPFLRDVVNAHQARWIHARLFPRLELSPPSVTITTDKKWLRFCCDQLLRNAFQYAAPGPDDPERPLVIRVTAQPHEVALAVQDFGVGIPASDQSRVFEAFFTGRNGREYPRSTGLGLYLVREAAARLGWTVDLTSTVGMGTTVTLVVPTARYHSPIRL